MRNRQFINGISAVANNGSGLVRVTRAAHGFATNDVVTVADVTVLNIGAAFWGLVAGFGVSWLMEKQDFTALANRT